MSREIYKRVGPHIDRVRYDGGVMDVKDGLFLLQQRNERKKASVKVAFCPELYGNKIRTSGNLNYITKGYSKDDAANDLTQTSSANQPVLDKIAPVEKLGAKNVSGSLCYLTHPSINFNATDKWTVEICINLLCGGNTTSNWIISNNKQAKSLIGLGNNFSNISFYNDNSVGASISLDGRRYIGKTSIITLVATGNGSVLIYINGIYVTTVNISTTMQFNTIISAYGTEISPQYLFSYHIFAEAFTASDVADGASILRSIFPEITSVRIGEQFWSARNYEAVCTPQGNLIPEVQSNATWSTSQTLYDNAYAAQSGTVEQKTYAGVKAAAMWCHYNNDVNLGATYGKLYNWFAVKLLQMDIDYYNAANPTTPWGWRVPTQSDFNTLATALGGANVAGGKMKMQGTTYWNSPNTGADNSSGFSSIPALMRIPSGGFGNGLNSNYLWHITGGFVELNNNTSVLSVYGSIDLKYGLSLRLIKANTDNLYDSLGSLLTDSTGDTLFVNI